MDTEDQGFQGDPGDEQWDEIDGERMRGWIPPDDRLWRHPSESGAPAAASAAPASASTRPGSRARTVPWIAGGATACVVLALVATSLIVMTADSSDQGRSSPEARIASLAAEPTTEPGVGRMPDAVVIAGIVSTARQSVVALRVTTIGRTTAGTGIVTESGGIIVTASRLVSGARAVTVVEANGDNQPASLVGIDQRSGLAVLRIGDDLPAARFDSNDPTGGSVAMAIALQPGPHSASPPTAKVYAGTVISSGRAAGSDSPTGRFSASVVTAPLSDDDIGCPLLDAAGHVSGMMAGTKRSDGSSAAIFLPAEVVLGVATQLVTAGAMDHGWLGVEGSDTGTTDPVSAHTATTVAATTPLDGARLDTVDKDSPAAGVGLQTGDVIVGIDGNPVHSNAELETRLYPDPPGTALDLTFLRGGTVQTASVILADPTTDVQGSGSSP